ELHAPIVTTINARTRNARPRDITRQSLSPRGHRAPTETLEIDGALPVEAQPLGLQHRALQARVLAVGRDAASGVHHAVPGDRALGGATTARRIAACADG